MRIDHVAIYVRDLEEAKSFFEKYFGATSGARYHNPKTGLQTYFLIFGDGARLEIMTRPQLLPPNESALQTGLTHIAFSVGSREAVDQLTNRLAGDGYQVQSGPRVTGDGYYESCVLGPENCALEITE